MYDVIPEVLSRARRGICPTCGAPLALAASGREAKCAFCGGGSTLQFRLRAIEASAGALQKPDIKGATRWLSKHASYERCNCPGCGAEFDVQAEQAIQTCTFCGAQSKLETRLLPITTDDVQPPQCRTDADFMNGRRGRIDYPWDISTEQLVWRILNEPELMPRVNLADEFQSWSFINHTAAHFLPWLLKHVQTDHDAVAFAACDAVGKLLCEGDPTLWPGVIQACRGVIFDVHCKRNVLSELGLGDAVCIKSLIDAAEFAAAQGAGEQACHALWGANNLIERNFPQIPVIAEIVLYRLFYVTGPVLGWALNALCNSYLRGRYPDDVLQRACDELATERPEVVPHLLSSIYAKPAESAAEYRARVQAVRDAASWGGRAAGIELLGTPPGHDEALYKDAVSLIEPLLGHERAGYSAEKVLYELITSQDATPQAVHDLVARQGEALAKRLRREYIRRNPQTPLLDHSKPIYWDSEPKRPLDEGINASLEEWKEGIHAAVDKHRALQAQLQPMRDQARELDVPLFLADEPATIPLKPEAAAEAAKQQQRTDELSERERRMPEINRLQKEMADVQTSYMAKIQTLSADMMQHMNDQKRIQSMSAEIMALSTEMQSKLAQLQEQLDALIN